MNAIIRGKRYDTEKAKLVAEDSFAIPGDFEHWEEELYVTQNSTWFVAGHGGPMTKYAQRGDSPGSTTGSERIEPLTEEEAKSWLENHGCYQALEEHFGFARGRMKLNERKHS